MASPVPFAKRLARFQAKQARTKAQAEERRKAREAQSVADKPRRKRIAAWKRSRIPKRIGKEECVLAMAREVLKREQHRGS
jgi:hypothetical protein